MGLQHKFASQTFFCHRSAGFQSPVLPFNSTEIPCGTTTNDKHTMASKQFFQRVKLIGSTSSGKIGKPSCALYNHVFPNFGHAGFYCYGIVYHSTLCTLSIGTEYPLSTGVLMMIDQTHQYHGDQAEEIISPFMALSIYH
jgi:hypothetical protein